MVVDNDMKESLEALFETELSPQDWNSVRQCVRALHKGQRIKGKEIVDGYPKMEVQKAFNLLVKEAKASKNVLGAARKLAFI
jgi:hypothetical protein